MSILVERDGCFQGRILEYGLREFESGAVAITVRAALDKIWDGENWLDWEQYEMEAIGSLFIIKKTGEINNQQVASIVKATGWDGSMNSVVHGTWKPTTCQFVIRGENYKGAMQYRIAFINELDSVPGGGMSNIDADKVKSLEAKYGASMRAVTGNVKRNSSPAPAAKSMPQPAKPAGAWKADAPAAKDAAKSTDEIPF